MLLIYLLNTSLRIIKPKGYWLMYDNVPYTYVCFEVIHTYSQVNNKYIFYSVPKINIYLLY